MQGDTLVLSFRGTDREDPIVQDGTTYVPEALAAHYKAFRSLIDSAFDYVQSHDGIHNIVVSGHSLGGAMVDIFTMVDAARFRELRPDGLTLISMASSGLPKELPTYMKSYDFDPAVVTVKEQEILGVPTGVYTIKNLTPPADYVSLTNAEDRAHFPDNYPDFPEAPGLAPILTLKENKHFGADVIFDNPNIENTDVAYYDPLTNPFDWRGMGAEHNSALLWANLQGLLSDPLKGLYGSQSLIFGITDYNTAVDWDGSPVPLFEGYDYLDEPGFDDDSGDKSLTGDRGANYMLGLTGDDRIDGRGGGDVLSGGAGRDVLAGGAGNDRLSGGTERDVQSGGTGGDRFFFTDLTHSGTGAARDVIMDFNVGEGDRIAVSLIDASVAAGGNQAFSLMIGATGFTGEGQVTALQNGDDTLLRFNVAGTGVSEMDILLKNVLAASLTADQFIL